MSEVKIKIKRRLVQQDEQPIKQTKSRYIRNEQGQFICPHCNVIKDNQNTMFYHMQKHEGRLPHECPTCQKGFIQKQELQIHILKHHPVNTVDNNIYCPHDGCTFCDVRKGNVRTHYMRKHVTEYLDGIMEKTATGYHCELCDQTMGSAAGFYYHLYGCFVAAQVAPVDSSTAEEMADLA